MCSKHLKHVKRSDARLVSHLFRVILSERNKLEIMKKSVAVRLKESKQRKREKAREELKDFVSIKERRFERRETQWKEARFVIERPRTELWIK